MALYVVHCDLTVVVWQSDNRWWREYFLLLKSDDYLCSSSEILGIQHDDPVCLTYSSLWTSSLQKQSFNQSSEHSIFQLLGAREIGTQLCGLHCSRQNQSLAPKLRTFKIASAGRRRYLLLICVEYKFAAKSIPLSPELRTSDSATLRMCSVQEHSRTESRPPQQRLYAPDSWSLSPGELI